LLNDNVFDAIIDKKIGMILMEDRPDYIDENTEPPIIFKYSDSNDVSHNNVGYVENSGNNCG
jgi:hypothetical protein